VSDSRKCDGNVTELRPGDLDALPPDGVIPPDEVLGGALGNYTHVVVVGIRKEDQDRSGRGGAVAFLNAFSKAFGSSEAPTSFAVFLKRAWRSASVSLFFFFAVFRGMVGNLRYA
jgi:hypothetical protein